LFRGLARGVAAQGGQIYDIGQVLTECLYFTIGSRDFKAGVMITASHNPKEYGGFKMVKKDDNYIKIIAGKDLLDQVVKDNSENVDPADDKILEVAEEKIIKEDIWHDYINHVLSFVDLSEISPLKIVIDASNGVGGIVLEKIKEKLPVEIISLNFEPNGNFPNHSPNPIAEGSTDQIKNEIIKQKADFGFLFDGDADRVFLVDETGKLVSSDATILILAKYFLQKNPGMGVVSHATCSKAIPEFVKKWGGKHIKTQVGFIHIQQGLEENNGIMGGELTGHYSFKDNFYCDSGVIAFLTLLQIISRDGRKISEIAKEFSPYYKPQEINFKVEDKNTIIEKIKEKYTDPSTPLGAGGKADFLDGITVTYKDWWFNVRASNTEPVLRLTIEADTKELYDEKQKELTKVISS